MELTSFFQQWKRYFANTPGSVDTFDSVFRSAQQLFHESAEQGHRLATQKSIDKDRLKKLEAEFIQALSAFESRIPAQNQLSVALKNYPAEIIPASRALVHYWSRAPKV